MSTLEPPAEIRADEYRTARGDFLTELGRIYLQIGLPLAAAVEAALADCKSFQITGPLEP